MDVTCHICLPFLLWPCGLHAVKVNVFLHRVGKLTGPYQFSKKVALRLAFLKDELKKEKKKRMSSHFSTIRAWPPPPTCNHFAKRRDILRSLKIANCFPLKGTRWPREEKRLSLFDCSPHIGPQVFTFSKWLFCLHFGSLEVSTHCHDSAAGGYTLRYTIGEHEM